MFGFGLNRMTAQAAKLNPFQKFVKDGNSVAKYNSLALSTITKDGSNIVSRVNDELGSGNDLIFGSCLWSDVDGFVFDGVTQYLKSAAIVALLQPTTIYLLLNQKSWTNLKYVMDGISPDSGILAQFTGTSPNLSAYAGSNFSSPFALPINTWGIITLIFNGINGQVRLNNDVIYSGNLGANDMGGITFGACAIIDYFSNVEIRQAIFRKVLPQEADYFLIENEWAKLYPTIDAYGDSITFGQAASSQDNTFVSIVGSHFYGKENHGVSGTTLSKRDPINPSASPNFVDASAAMPNKTLFQKYLILGYGVNDIYFSTIHANYTVENFTTDYNTALDNCIAKGWTAEKIIILSPPYITVVDESIAIPFVQATADIANSRGCKYVELFQKMKLAGIVPVDEWHPGNDGHALIAAEILKVAV